MRTLILSRPDRVGDVVISTSCLAPIRAKYPGVAIHFVAAERMRPLLEGHPLLAGYIPLSADLTAEFQCLNAEAIVHLHPHEGCYLAAHRAGVPRRIGYPVRTQNHLLTDVIPDRRKEGLQHEAAYNFDLLRAAGSAAARATDAASSAPGNQSPHVAGETAVAAGRNPVRRAPSRGAFQNRALAGGEFFAARRTPANRVQFVACIHRRRSA